MVADEVSQVSILNKLMISDKPKLQPTIVLTDYLGGKVATSLEFLEEGRHEESREEQDGGPEENVWGVGAMVAARRTYKLAMQTDALLWRFICYINTFLLTCRLPHLTQNRLRETQRRRA